jgi:hypothetical protein
MSSETRKTKGRTTIMKVGGEKIFGVWGGGWSRSWLSVFALGPPKALCLGGLATGNTVVV